ncbi:MAG: DUF3108 domain-containing protein [Elusimicrobia bacterium]|nr:DUF3108 domain-containing protein [Elusimicrobiota bacterium]
MLNIEYRINWIKDLFPYIQYSIFNILSLAAVFSLPLVALEGLTTAASAPGHGAGDASFMDLARTIGLGREEYVYSVEWGFLKVGRAQLGSSEIVKYENKDAYHIVSYAKTLPFFDTFYKVRDKNEAWLETRKFFSLGFGKHLREGHFRRNETVSSAIRSGCRPANFIAWSWSPPCAVKAFLFKKANQCRFG